MTIVDEKAPPRLSGILSMRVKRRRIGRALRFVRPGSRVLDLGCGLGEVVALLPDGCFYTGVDRDGYMIERNRAIHPGISFLQADLANTPPPAGPWDAILLLAVLEHLADPAGLLHGAARVLAPGGVVIVTTPHPSGEWIHRRFSCLGLLSSHAEEEHDALLDRRQIEKMGQTAGLRITFWKRFLLGLNQIAVFTRGGGS